MKKIFILFLISSFMFSCDKENAKTKIEEPPVIKKDSVVEEKKEAPKVVTLVFTVQIGAYQTQNSQLSQVSNVQVSEEENLYKYRLGAFNTYQEARKQRRKLLSQYPDAFVQALFNGKPIAIKKALQ